MTPKTKNARKQRLMQCVLRLLALTDREVDKEWERDLLYIVTDIMVVATGTIKLIEKEENETP